MQYFTKVRLKSVKSKYVNMSKTIARRSRYRLKVKGERLKAGNLIASLWTLFSVWCKV